jgi:hypothetical protein
VKQLFLSFTGKAFSWSFLLAAVQFPILGVDFLRHYGLLVDLAGYQLVDRLMLQAFPSSPPFPGYFLLLSQALPPLQLSSSGSPSGFGLSAPSSPPLRTSLSMDTSLLTSAPASPHRPLQGANGLCTSHWVAGLFLPCWSVGGSLWCLTCKRALRSFGTPLKAATVPSRVAGLLKEFPASLRSFQMWLIRARLFRLQSTGWSITL